MNTVLSKRIAQLVLIISLSLWSIIAIFATQANSAPDIAAVRTSTVWILSGNESGGSSGSGFLVGNGSYAVTNWHVVNNTLHGARVRVVFGKDNVLPAKVLSYSEQKDIAILQLIGNSGRPPAKLATPGEVRVGDPVYVMGFPGTIVSAEQMRNITAIEETVTRGIISRKVRLQNGVNYFQTDAAINPGNSGGPMFNEKGAVVGIVTMRLEGKGNNRIDGIGFAVAIDELLSELSAAGISANGRVVDKPAGAKPSDSKDRQPLVTNEPPDNQNKQTVPSEAEQSSRKIFIKRFAYPIIGLVLLGGCVLGAWVIWNKNH